MDGRQISTTARGIAAIRAVESERPAGQRICYDPLARPFAGPVFYLLAKLFAGYGERAGPGVQGFLVCRCRYIDDFLQERLRSGTRQVVILGAGLDSRAYRGSLLPGGIRVFEVDRPATQAAKMERVREALGEIPANVTFVPADFNVESLDKLIACGFDRSLKSLFIWEGVTYYLHPGAVDATLSWVSANAVPGSALIFDYVYRAALMTAQKRGEIRRMQRYRGLTGEGLTFGFEENEVAGYLTRRGFTRVVEARAEDLRRLYCTGPNQGRRVAEIYAIAHAEVGGERA